MLRSFQTTLGVTVAFFSAGLLAVYESVILSTTVVIPIYGNNGNGGTANSKNGADNVSYQLAYEQSFGFFDDISDRQWKQAQKIHLASFPNHYETTVLQYTAPLMTKKQQANQPPCQANKWYAQNFHVEFHCPGAQRIPSDGAGDGPKWVCDPHRLANDDCLVYSVGSNGKSEFERGIVQHIGSHCEIHTFDVNGYNRRFGRFEEALANVSTFHEWGIGTQAQANRYAKTKRGSPLKTLKQTMQELGHVNRTISIFKIDCEGCEWDVYPEWLMLSDSLIDIRQLLVETHVAPMPAARDLFYRLHDAGYVIFSKEPNLYAGGMLVEYGFIKLRTDFFLNQSLYSKRLGMTNDETATKM